MKKLCTLFVVFSAVCLAQESADVPAQGGMRGRGHGAPAAHDGKLTPELRERLLKNFDANGNGRLDEDEIAAARKAKAERQGKRAEHPHRAPQTSAETGEHRRPQGGHEMSAETKARLLKKFDANGNGELDPEEMAEVRKAHNAQQGDNAAARPQGEHRSHRGGMRRRAQGSAE